MAVRGHPRYFGQLSDRLQYADPETSSKRQAGAYFSKESGNLYPLAHRLGISKINGIRRLVFRYLNSTEFYKIIWWRKSAGSVRPWWMRSQKLEEYTTERRLKGSGRPKHITQFSAKCRTRGKRFGKSMIWLLSVAFYPVMFVTFTYGILELMPGH